MKTFYFLIIGLLFSVLKTNAAIPDDHVYTLGQPYEFTGSNFINIGTSADYEPGTGSFSVMFSMIAKKGSATTQIIAAKGNAGSTVSGWMAILGEGYLGFRVCGTNTTGNYRASARIPFPDSYLHKLMYVSAVVDRTTGKVELYLNGSKNGVQYTGFGPTGNLIDANQNISSASPLYLGQRSDEGAKFTGRIEDFAIYKRALSISEIQSVMPEGLLAVNINGIENFVFNPHQYTYNLSSTINVEDLSFNCTFVGDVTVTLNNDTLKSEENSKLITLNPDEEKTLILTVKKNATNTTESYKFNIKRTQQYLKKVTVFERNKEGYHTYRIPAIIRAPNGDLLAFCEGRKNGSGDAGDIDLVMKRSTDNGHTWSAVRMLVDFKQLLSPDSKTYGSLYGDYTVGNMAPVVDMMDPEHPNGRIVMPFNTNGAEAEGTVMGGTGVREIWVTTSDDNGYTWSTPKNITTSVSKPNEPNFNPAYNFAEDWRWYAVTPGHAIQLKKSKYAGRLVFAANHSAGATGGTYFSHCFYSDDHGKTWKLGNNVGAKTNEAIAAELSNGNVMINMRNYDGTGRRAVATSYDGGETWQNLFRDPQLPEPVCQGTILYNDSARVLHFANPASTSGRNNLTIRTSFDDGKTWAYKRTVELSDGAYSDLVLQSDQKIGLLYETSGYSLINYAIVNNEWIMGGEKTSSATGTGTQSNRLSKLVLSGNIKNFSFNPDIYSYTLSADYATPSITITPSAMAGSIFVNGKIVTSGSSTTPISLTPGTEEFINITVTETDKKPSNYIFRITREPSNTRISNKKKNSLSCFPNPSKGIIYYHLPGNEQTEISVLSICGKNMPFSKTDTQIDLSLLENGTYVLQFKTVSGSFNQIVSLHK